MATAEAGQSVASGAVPHAGEARRVLLVAGVALALRLAAFLVARAHDPLLAHPILDGFYHDLLARQLLDGTGWGDEAYFRAPLYPWLLAGAYAVSGGSIAFALVLQHLLGAATAVLVYLLARRHVCAGWALGAGLVAAAYWPCLYFEDELLIVTTILFLDVAALLLLTLALEGGRTALFAAGGLLLGLSAVARPSVLVVLPFLPLAFRCAGGPWLRRSLVTWACALVPILPVTARNWLVGHDLVLIASQGGVNFHIGNNPEADGVTAVVPGTRGDWMGGYEDAIRRAEEEEGRPLLPSEVSRHYFRKGWAFVVGEPARSVPLLLKKLRLAWAAGERPNNKQVYFFWQELRLGRWHLPLPGFWLVGPLGLVGLFLARRRAGLRLLVVFVVAYLAGVVAFFVNARFRLPVVPALVVLGTVAAAELAADLRARRRRGAWTLAGLALAVLLVDGDLLSFQRRSPATDALSWASVGNARDDAGDTRGAIEAYERALDLNQEARTREFQEISPRVLFNLGRCLWREGERGRGLQLMERGDSDDPRRVRDKVFLAAGYVELGRKDDAARTFAEIAALPGQETFLLSLARGWRTKGSAERAELALEALVERGGPTAAAAREELLELRRGRAAGEDGGGA